MVVLTLIGILTSLCARSFPRAIEQARADLAAANLRTIWAAQRFYRLENGLYAESVARLRQADLIDTNILSPADPPETIAQYQPSYLYEITSSDLNTFTASATRNSTAVVEDRRTLSIDESGTITGEVRLVGMPAERPSITPGRIFKAAD